VIVSGCSGLGQANQPGTAVGRVGHELDQTAGRQVRERLADGLLADLHATREIGRPDATARQVRKQAYQRRGQHPAASLPVHFGLSNLVQLAGALEQGRAKGRRRLVTGSGHVGT
jgi:hypothetical protein